MKNTKNTGILILIAIVIFGAVYVMQKSGTSDLFSVDIVRNGDTVHTDTLKVSNTYGATQSLLDTGSESNPFLLMATKPVSQDYEERFVLQAKVENTYDKDMRVTYVEFLKNDKQIDMYPIREKVLAPGDTYIFRKETKPIGNIGEKNTITFDFTLESNDGTNEVHHKFYIYEYAYLKTCEFDTDCPEETPLCDLQNVARFVNGGPFRYCVKVCEKNADCGEDQICIAGRCGY